MESDYNTLELARIYENQGYFEDALSVYTALDASAQGQDLEIHAACQRMTKALGMDAQEGPLESQDAQGRVKGLMEQWMELLVAEQRLRVFQDIKNRI
ncbi:MAG: hypothetical protein MI747_14480 [Desulfobacterales bacterium]|nr:hypothetical protein [Desulfobacterales bacterium]